MNWTFPCASKIVLFPSRSVHARVSFWPASGLVFVARPSACCPRNLPTENFSAVFPVPNRSYEAPARIVQSFQHGRHATGAIVRRAVCAVADMKRPATAVCAGVEALK